MLVVIDSISGYYFGTKPKNDANQLSESELNEVVVSFRLRLDPM